MFAEVGSSQALFMPQNARSLDGVDLQAHGPALLRYASHLLKDSSVAQDVVQDTFTRFWSHPPPPDVTGAESSHRLRAWLLTVCRNRAFDVMKKDRRATRLPDAVAEARTNPAPGPAAVVEDRDTLAAVRERLARLPDQQQEVVRLRFQSELSYKQIAGVTGLTASNVGYLLHQAIKTLRQQMTAAQLDGPRPLDPENTSP